MISPFAVILRKAGRTVGVGASRSGLAIGTISFLSESALNQDDALLEQGCHETCQ